MSPAASPTSVASRPQQTFLQSSGSMMLSDAPHDCQMTRWQPNGMQNGLGFSMASGWNLPWTLTMIRVTRFVQTRLQKLWRPTRSKPKRHCEKDMSMGHGASCLVCVRLVSLSSFAGRSCWSDWHYPADGLCPFYTLKRIASSVCLAAAESYFKHSSALEVQLES